MGITIDGTSITGATIDGTDVQEITIDGVSVWTAGPSFSVIDDFEDNNIDEYTQNNYSDPWGVNSVNVHSSIVWEGSYAVDMYLGAGKDDADYSIVSSSGLGDYPSQGDIFSAWFRFALNNKKMEFLFGMQGTGHPTDTNSGYGVSLGSSGIELNRYDSGSLTTLASTSQSYSSDTWYKFYIDWASDGTITFTLKDSSESNINSISSTDTNYTSGGIGWRNVIGNTNEGNLYCDYAIIE